MDRIRPSTATRLDKINGLPIIIHPSFKNKDAIDPPAEFYNPNYIKPMKNFRENDPDKLGRIAALATKVFRM